MTPDLPPKAGSPGDERDPGPSGRRWRLGAGVLGGVALLGVLVAIVAVVLAHSETLVRWGLAQAVEAAGGRLEIEGTGGTLRSGINARRIVWHDRTLTVSIEQGRVVPDWRALARGRPALRAASASRVEVVLQPSDAAAALPESLTVPVPVEVGLLQVGELQIRVAGAQDALRLTDLSTSLRGSAAGWTVDALRVDGPFGRLDAGGTLGATAPFPLSWRVLLETSLPGEPATVDATLEGTLADLTVQARTVLREASARATARLAPFEPIPLRGLEVAFDHLDLARFAPALPQTQLTARLRARLPEGAAPAGPLPPLEGDLTVRNARPGRLDLQRLPWAAARARWAFDGTRLSVGELLLDGAPGRVVATATLGLPLPAAGSGTLPDFRLTLRTEALDLAQVHGRLQRAALRGDLRIVPDAVALAVEGRLADGDRALEAAVRWANDRLEIRRAQVRAREGVATIAGTAATVAPYGFDLAGEVSRLDPARFLDLPAGRLSGRWRASGALGRSPAVRASVSLADSAWDGRPLSGTAALSWRSDRVSDLDVMLRWGATALTARGALGAADDRLALTLEAGRLRELDARVAGRATLTGALRGHWAAPAGTAVLQVRDLVTELGGGLRVDALQATAAVSRPEALRELLARLGVSVPVPAGLRSPRPGPEPAGEAGGAAAAPLAVSAEVTGLALGDLAVARSTLALQGEADRHSLAVSVRGPLRLKAGSEPVPVDAALRLEGALTADGAGPAWRGRLVEATHAVFPTLRLRAPAPIAAASGSLTAGPLELESDALGGAGLTVQTLALVEGRVRLVAALTGVPLRVFQPILPAQGLQFDAPDALRMGARIDLTGAPGAGGDLRGRLEVFRESGDLSVALPAAGGTGTEALRAGLQALQARIDLGDGEIRATASLRGTAIGDLRMQARAPLAWTPSGGLDTSARVTGQAEFDLPSLAFTRSVIGETWRFDGVLSARLTLAGTLADPRASGQVTGRDLIAEQRELGLKLTDGTLTARLRDNAIEIDTLRFASGQGRVTMTGSLRADERSEAVVTLERMPAPLGAGQRLVLSGEARASFARNVLRLRGALRADEGVIELTAGNAPTLSRDVVVVRDAAEAAKLRAAAARRTLTGGAADEADPEAGPGFRVSANLQIDLGDRLRVIGSGVDARLAGQLTLRGRIPDAPRLTGTVRIVQGTYTGFGQKLEIERGTLVFSGPVDNPAIDVVAYRRYLPVEAGVALTGTARTPRLALVSRPDVPDPDKLSWLVLGTSSDTARSGGQSAALQTAAATLLAAADPNASGPGIASTFGLDVLSIRTSQAGTSGESASAGGSAQDSVVTLGKRLTERLFISYEQSLRGLQNLVRLQYEITERLSVRARAGTQNGVDLLWTYRYD